LGVGGGGGRGNFLGQERPLTVPSGRRLAEKKASGGEYLENSGPGEGFEEGKRKTDGGGFEDPRDPTGCGRAEKKM